MIFHMRYDDDIKQKMGQKPNLDGIRDLYDYEMGEGGASPRKILCS